jgi:DNA-binding response OmpR family regulator
MAFGKTVLIVEDDALIRLGLADALADEGFDVVDCSNALEAIAELGQDRLIDAMVTDVDMPGPLNGIHLATMTDRLFPRMLTCVSSGRREVAGHLREGTLFFPKPASGADIARRLGVLLANADQLLRVG